MMLFVELCGGVSIQNVVISANELSNSVKIPVRSIECRSCQFPLFSFFRLFPLQKMRLKIYVSIYWR